MESRIETTLLNEEWPVSSDFLETLVEQRVGPGILLLSPALKLMHMNRRAWELIRKITQAENGKAATGVLPPTVTELCAEVSAALRSKSTSSTSWRKPAAPLARASSRGFSLPDRPLWPQRRSVPALRPATEAGWRVNVDSCLCPFEPLEIPCAGVFNIVQIRSDSLTRPTAPSKPRLIVNHELKRIPSKSMNPFAYA